MKKIFLAKILGSYSEQYIGYESNSIKKINKYLDDISREIRIKEEELEPSDWLDNFPQNQYNMY